jgi:hypothetical protein
MRHGSLLGFKEKFRLQNSHFYKLQPLAVPKARTRKLPFQVDFDPRDHLARISMSFPPIGMKYS